MSKQAYVEIRFKARSEALIGVINLIINEYLDAGYKLTVRQVYYQLVARGHIENTERSYKATASLINDARMAGRLDWDAIEDRTRDFIKRPRWSSGGDILGSVARQFHMDMWANQDRRVFVVVEKEALVGVLESTCMQYDVPLLAARGYPSASVLREFAVQDLMDCPNEGGVILHLGDHDPSGIDMTRDLMDRLDVLSEGVPFDLHRIALNLDQVQERKPPPNPAKVTDSRFVSYRKRFGASSWELDALDPAYLNELVTEHIGMYIDEAKWKTRAAKIKTIKSKLAKVAADFKD